ncbi:MAG: gliding motility-associated C-terminal domain-containing protein, partial [Gemmatimonadota bacterium]|nr:gliding motility-associated C-terminal domain-containing protein [Gemmatimonadota bacterium]
QGARGSVAPREASPNQDTHFTYTLWPETDELDSGFDLMRFTVPEPVDLQSVSIMVGAEPVVPATLDMQADSLLIALPQAISGDSLQVSFTTRLLQNATVFTLDLGLSEAPGLWQSVEAAERRSNIVMLPELTDSGQLISDLQLASTTVTPNGDGINDQLEVRFVAFKVEGTEPQVEVFDLAGRQIAVLTPSTEGSQRLFTWDGRNADGASAAPGLYVLRVNLGADAGNDTAFRTIAVAY